MITPLAIRRLLPRCLEKDRRQRLDSAAAVRLDIEEAIKGPDSAAPSVGAVTPAPRSARLPWAVAAVASALALGVVAWWAPWRAQPEPAKISFEVPADTIGGTAANMLAVSPDGKLLVAVRNANNSTALWLRPLDRTAWTPVPGTEDARYPFWSPDSRHIGFSADGKLKVTDVFSPAATSLTDDPGNTFGGAWNRGGVILFAKNVGPLVRVSASGGESVPATELNIGSGETAHRFPRFLPDGDHFLYFAQSSKPESEGVFVGSLTSKEVRHVMATPTRGDFAPPNHLLFLRGSTLMAQRFDLRSLVVQGDPVQVTAGVVGTTINGSGGFSASDNGVLAIRSGGVSGGQELTWLDSSGKRQSTVGGPGIYENPSLSPDGKRLAVYQRDESGGGDIWIVDLALNNRTKFTFDPAVYIPVWSPDGRWIAFSSKGRRHIQSVPEERRWRDCRGRAGAEDERQQARGQLVTVTQG